MLTMMEPMEWELLLQVALPGLALAQLCLNTLKVLMQSKSNALLNNKTELEIALLHKDLAKQSS